MVNLIVLITTQESFCVVIAMPKFRRHSPTAQAAYQDLVSLLLDEAISEIRGAPVSREINKKPYWYDRYRLGEKIHERYLGEDSAALRARIDRHKALKDSRESRRRETTRLVRLLASERFLRTDGATGSLVSALTRVGTFRLGGVLVGTNAFRMYEGELGLRLTLDATATTNDVDIASFEKLSLAIGETVLPSVDEALGELDFSPAPSLDGDKVWRWRQSSSGTLVEFLTPSFDAEEGLRELPALGVSAQSLHFLNFLIAEPIHAAAIYREGILVRIPRPERFAIHKLIVADRRLSGPDSAKSRKDLLQAELLASILAEDRPADLREAYEDAMSRDPKWRERIERSLKRAPAIAELLARAA